MSKGLMGRREENDNSGTSVRVRGRRESMIFRGMGEAHYGWTGTFSTRARHEEWLGPDGVGSSPSLKESGYYLRAEGASDGF